MTKKELLLKIKNFIEAQDDIVKDEVYCTDRELAKTVLCDFAKSQLNVELDIDES